MEQEDVGGGRGGGLCTCMHKPVNIMYVNTSHRSRNRREGPGGPGGPAPINILGGGTWPTQ